MSESQANDSFFGRKPVIFFSLLKFVTRARRSSTQLILYALEDPLSGATAGAFARKRWRSPTPLLCSTACKSLIASTKLVGPIRKLTLRKGRMVFSTELRIWVAMFRRAKTVARFSPCRWGFPLLSKPFLASAKLGDKSAFLGISWRNNCCQLQRDTGDV